MCPRFDSGSRHHPNKHWPSADLRQKNRLSYNKSYNKFSPVCSCSRMFEEIPGAGGDQINRPNFRPRPITPRTKKSAKRSPAHRLGIENHVGVTIDNCDNCDNCANWRTDLVVQTALSVILPSKAPFSCGTFRIVHSKTLDQRKKRME